MLIRIVIVSLLSSFALDQAPESGDVAPEVLLQRGREAYRNAQYAEAARDLENAAQEFLSTERMQRYVQTGELETLPQLEMSLVYLALAEAKLGREEDAHKAIMRLVTAERIEEAYAWLPLDEHALEFEPLVARIAPGIKLPANLRLAELRSPGSGRASEIMGSQAPDTGMTAIPAVVPRSTPQGNAPTASQLAAAEREAADCAAVLKAAEERIAAERAASERRIAAERESILRAAEERIAAERVASQRAADERVAAERANAERTIQERVAAERAAAEERLAAASAGVRRSNLATLRDADALADSGRFREAADLYIRVANSEGAPREVIAAAGSGLYRIGEYFEAARAFRRLGTFKRGEEDIRYYHAVSLYETGNFVDARRELACAIPFLQVTTDVTRYRMKIEEAR